MPSSLSWTIFKKEFREIFRDKRTIISVVVGPILVTPAIFALLGSAVSKKVEAAVQKTYPIGVVNAQAAPQIVQALRQATGLKVEEVSAKEAENQIKARKLNAALVLPEGLETQMALQQTAKLEILQDAGNEDSLAVTGRLTALFQKVEEQVVQQRLTLNGLSPELAKPFQVTTKPIASGGSMGMLMLTQMLPYILILAAFSGAIYAAFDQVAGEKERGTLETLLVSPATRRDIVLGKFAAVVGVCLVSSLLTIVGMMIPFFSGLKAYEFLARGGVHLEPTAIFVILMVILPLSILFAGALLAVSTFSRNQKEAQTYLGTMFPIVLVPALLSMFIGENASKAVALAPILNVSVIIKQAINGSYDPAFIGLACVASIFYAAAALFIATRLFQRESVLIKA